MSISMENKHAGAGPAVVAEVDPAGAVLGASRGRAASPRERERERERERGVHVTRPCNATNKLSWHRDMHMMDNVTLIWNAFFSPISYSRSLQRF